MSQKRKHVRRMRVVSLDPRKVRKLRAQRNWTQVELAQKAGVAERTIRNIETGQSVRRDFAGFIATAMLVPLEELLPDDQMPVSLEHDALSLSMPYRPNPIDMLNTFQRGFAAGDWSGIQASWTPATTLKLRCYPAHDMDSDWNGWEAIEATLTRLRNSLTQVPADSLKVTSVNAKGDIWFLVGKWEPTAEAETTQILIDWYLVLEWSLNRVDLATLVLGITASLRP